MSSSRFISYAAAASTASFMGLVGVNGVEKLLIPQPFLDQKTQCEAVLRHKLIRVNEKKIALPQNGFDALRSDMENVTTGQLSCCQDFI